ncbi:MAG: hypothetical protein OIF51_16500, partial [Cellvibrionaceae bacterium]|nr:hypothetical protein [Cellvibrionaceae bacterium]
VAIEECVWEGQQLPPMPAGAAATNSAASGRGMGRSGIEMPVFSALISCDRRVRVGGAAGASNACRGCCHKQRGKWQGWGVRASKCPLISARKRSVIVRSVIVRIGRSAIFVTLGVLALTIDATAFYFTLTLKNSFIFQSLIDISFVA